MDQTTQNLLKNRIKIIIESNITTTVITILILLNAVILGLETDDYFASKFGGILNWADKFILILFSFELILNFMFIALNFFIQVEHLRSFDCNHCGCRLTV